MGTILDKIQYVTDNSGQQTAVVVPTNEWNNLLEIITERQDFEASLDNAVKDLNQVKTGDLQPRPLQDLLDEL